MKEIPEQERLVALLKTGRYQQRPKGQVLQFSDDQAAASYLATGYVKRYSIANDGSQSIQSFYGPGDVFPLTPVFHVLLEQSLYTGDDVMYYEAMSPIQFYSISGSKLKEAVAEDPYLYHDLMYVCGVRLHSNIHRLENIALKQAQKQVAHQLLYLAERFGSITEKSITLDVPITHQTLASSVNLARETVTLSLNRLQEKGLVETEPKLTIIDIQGLRRAAS